VLLSGHFPVTLGEIRSSWTFDDVALANAVIDEIERVHGVAEERAKREAKARRPGR